MPDQDIGKRRAAEAALEFLPQDEVIGVGTGSTVNFFIDCLGALRQRIKRRRRKLGGHRQTPAGAGHRVWST